MHNYEAYGPSSKCSDDGEGGPMANAVYEINNGYYTFYCLITSILFLFFYPKMNQINLNSYSNYIQIYHTYTKDAGKIWLGKTGLSKTLKETVVS